MEHFVFVFGRYDGLAQQAICNDGIWEVCSGGGCSAVDSTACSAVSSPAAAPTDVQATRLLAGKQVWVEWSLVTDFGGCLLESYGVFARGEGGEFVKVGDTDANPCSTSYEVDGLATNAPYDFAVQARAGGMHFAVGVVGWGGSRVVSVQC